MAVPGTKAEYKGVEYVAVDSNHTNHLGCDDCAFNKGAAEPMCHKTGCAGVVHMTIPDAIKHRLTS